jgi:hypothetical protein
MRFMALMVVIACAALGGCATGSTKQASNSPSCSSSGGSAQAVACAATIGVTAIIHSAQGD